MKKYVIICAAVAVAMSVASCKSSESAYKKAYEKALAAEQTAQKEPAKETVIKEVPVVQEAPAQTVVPVQKVETPVVDESNVAVRNESVTVVNGNALKAYSVVVGSFGVRANAERLMSELRSKGYDARVASSGSMYRVVAASFDSKGSAIAERNNLMSSFPDAWLLYRK